ncbi:MAG: hypothetical protein ACKPEY_08560, partial [Planctomycetota bacterium]
PMQFSVSALLAGDNSFDTTEPTDWDKKIGELETKAQGFAGTLFEQPLLEGFQINVREPLALSNDPARLKTLGAALVPNLLKLDDAAQQVESAAWAVLSRAPSPSETDILVEYLGSQSATSKDGVTDAAAIAEQRRKAIESMIWAFVAGSEFRFNH